MTDYVFLKAADIQRSLFAHFIRRQVVTKCWRQRDGEFVILDDPFVDDWDEAAYDRLLRDLRDILGAQGMALGAFRVSELKGFAAARAELFGRKKEYLDLPYLHVSEDLRGQGIGRALFERVKRWAAVRGAGKLYISAHSSVESQAFYRALGCVDAVEPNADHIRLEPYDLQMEYRLPNIQKCAPPNRYGQ